MVPDLAWALLIVILSILTGWLGIRAWKSPQGWIKWPGSLLSGIAALILLVILVLGLLPTPRDVAPIPTPGHTGAPDNAPTSPAVVGSPRTLTVAPGGSIQAAVDQAKPGDTVRVSPGVYHEAIKVHTDNVTLQGIPDG